MRADRTVPGRPVSSGETVAEKVVEVIVATLERSHHLNREEVSQELDPAKPALALLANAGFLADGGLVLVAPGLRLEVTVPVGEKAIRASEDTTPARGAADAETWTLHLPGPAPYTGLVGAVAAEAPHLTIDKPPIEAPERAAAAVQVDLAGLAGLDTSNRGGRT
jgi:hypothetical protein